MRNGSSRTRLLAGRPLGLALVLAFGASAAAAFAAEDPAGRDWVEAAWREHCAGDLRAAREAYEGIAARFPNHPRAPEALLRAALCLEKQGDLEGARALAGRVLAGHGKVPAARSRAEEILARLEGLSTRAAREREGEAVVRENEALKLNLAALQERLDRTLASLREGARDEVRRREEVEGLRARIDDLSHEGERLRDKLKTLPGGAKEESLAPEEILSRLEQDTAIREEQRRFLAENYFRTGLKLQAEERLEEARDNYRQCLSLWDGHPKAREHLMRVGALLGDPESRQNEILDQLEIARELRIQEAKIDLGNALRDAFEFYRKGAFEEAWRLFRRALDIVVRDLPQGPEFDRQKDLAARYIRLCQKEMTGARPSGQGAAEVRVRAFALPAGRLTELAREAGWSFTPCGTALTRGAGASVPAGRKEALEKALSGAGAPLIDERLTLASGAARALEKTGGGTATASPALRLRLVPGIAPGRLDLEVSAEAVLFPGRVLELPGAGGTVGAAVALSQTLTARLGIPASGASLLAGLRNPFSRGGGEAEAGEILFVIEAIG